MPVARLAPGLSRLRRLGLTPRLGLGSAAASALAATLACGSGGGTKAPTGPTAGPAQIFAQFEGAASGVAGLTSVRDTIGAVRTVVLDVTGADGGPVGGVHVDWALEASGDAVARLGAPASVTNAQGRAAVTWSFGTVAKPRWLFASVGGRQVAQLLAVIDEGRVTRLVASAERLVLGRERDTVVVTLNAADRAGNTLPVATGTWTVADTTVARVRRGYAMSPVAVQAIGRGTTQLTAQAGDARVSVTVAVPQYTWLVAGSGHSCAADAAGALACWGGNYSGELGLGTSGYQEQPAPVLPGVTVAGVWMAADNVCALAADGAAYCAGSNVTGNTGGGDVALSHPTPVRVAADVPFARLAVGFDAACGLTAGGAAYCWGSNGGGMLARADTVQLCRVTDIATTPCARAPVPVAPALRFVDLRAGPQNQACGVTASGDAYCWGGDANGELGAGDAAPLCNASGFHCRRAPTRVASDAAFRVVEPGYDHTCGAARDGRASCWGRGYTAWNASRPQPVAPGLAFVDLARAGQFADGNMCGLTAAGDAWCWAPATAATPRRVGGGYRSITTDRTADGLLVCGPLRLGGVRCDLLPPVGAAVRAAAGPRAGRRAVGR